MLPFEIAPANNAGMVNESALGSLLGCVGPLSLVSSKVQLKARVYLCRMETRRVFPKLSLASETLARRGVENLDSTPQTFLSSNRM